jgi:uncharacterized protein UPF0158
MSATVLLQDIVDALEMQLDESSSFLDLDTGRVETVSNEFLGESDESVGEEPGFPAWQKHEFEVAKRIVSTDRFEQLPTKFDVHEWAIMRDFSNSVALERVREDLLNAIHGAGAFRHFKDTLRRHRIESAWFTFRAQALKHIALDWCEEHHIRWQ